MRIALFADVQNVYYTTRQAYGRQFNYRELWQKVEARGDITHAFAYAIHRGDARQLKFQSALQHIGFEVKLKPFIQRQDGSAKGDWDVGITIDVLDVAPEVDVVVMVTGDGDFAPLLGKVSSAHGVRTEVYGVPALTSNTLIAAAEAYHPIDEALLM